MSPLKSCCQTCCKTSREKTGCRQAGRRASCQASQPGSGSTVCFSSSHLDSHASANAGRRVDRSNHPNQRFLSAGYRDAQLMQRVAVQVGGACRHTFQPGR